jgi:hypothetical protein
MAAPWGVKNDNGLHYIKQYKMQKTKQATGLVTSEWYGYLFQQGRVYHEESPVTIWKV